MSLKRGIEVGVREGIRTGVGPVYIRPIAATHDFSQPVAVFTRPSADDLPGELGIPAAVPVAVWKCDETSGTTLADSRGNVGLTASLASSVIIGASGYGLNGGAGTMVDVPVAESVRELVNANFMAATSSLLDFPSGSIGILTVVRLAGHVPNQRGLVGKEDTVPIGPAEPVGYGVSVLSPSGTPYIKTSDGGTGGTVNFSATNHPLCDGAWHYLTIVWDRTEDEVTVITDKAAAQTVSLGPVTGSLSAPFALFRLGMPRQNMNSAGAQFAYAAIFTGSAAEALNDKTALDAWWLDQTHNTPAGWAYSRASTLGCQIGSGSEGVRLNVWGTGKYALGYGDSLPGNGLGAMCAPAITNLIPQTDMAMNTNQSSWVSSQNDTMWGISGSLTAKFGTDPRGLRNSILIEKTGSQDKATMAVSLTSGTQYCFSVYTRSTSSVPFLRVLNDSATTVMYTEVSRSDGRPVVADSGWHQIFMRYTPSSSSLYRFEVLPSTHSSSVGAAEFQYPQLNTGPSPLPLAWTAGSSAATAKTVMKRPLTVNERRSIGARGAISASAQSHIADSGPSMWAAAIGQEGSLARSRGIGFVSTEQAVCFVYDSAGVFVDQATTVAIDPRVAADWVGQWDTRGIRGTAEQIHVRAGQTEDTDPGPFTDVADPSHIYIGSLSTESSQFVGVVRDVTVYRDPPEDP